MLGKVDLNHPQVRFAWDNAIRQAGIEQPPKGARIDMGDFYPRCALLAVDAQLKKLEAIRADAETLAGLVLTLFETNGYKHQHGPIRDEILRLAAKLAPQPVAVVEGVAVAGKYAELPISGTIAGNGAPLAPGVWALDGGPAETGESGKVRFERVDGDKIDG